MSIMVISESAKAAASAFTCVTRAQAAGQTLLWKVCDGVDGATACLRSSRQEGADLVLLDMDVPAEGDPLSDALARLEVPFIEVHDRDDAMTHPALVTVVVPGDRVAGVNMALSIALRYLADPARMAA
ncbi:hypothetical protein FHW69_002970 [Luteibacter sp. Sphag1AF]|uniref:hypothetical protein n=1 Tax=Luteibacter sp. Sphag1AF TaxID=2587031 RepID=UPI001617E626|nr:hypothetical protein [Luteibacter sp. Sphag1AF]MBB3228335.1 hypothetical protein [Luteibacter sp. Sphag1AF]